MERRAWLLGCMAQTVPMRLLVSAHEVQRVWVLALRLLLRADEVIE